jgi:hypothetical protein
VSARIEVEIDEVVLHGIGPTDRNAIAEAMRLEIARRLGSAETATRLAGSKGTERLDAGTFRHAGSEPPRAVGTRIGGAVAGSIQSMPAATVLGKGRGA